MRMNRVIGRLLINLSTVFILLNISSHHCLASFRFSPLKFLLESDFKITSMEIHNESDKSKFIHATILKWTQINGKDAYEATNDIFITPVIFEIKPDERQVIRFAQEQDQDKIALPDDKERTYRIFLKEISKQDKKEPAINFTFQFSFPFFIKPKNFRPLDDKILREKLLIARNNGEVSLTNNLNTSIHITEAVLNPPSDNQKTRTIHSYLLPGQNITIKYDKYDIVDGSIQALNIQHYGDEYTVSLSDSK